MIEEQIKAFVKRGPVTLAAVLPRGSSHFYKDILEYLLHQKITVAPFYVNRGIGESYGPIHPVLYKGRKLLIVDKDFSGDAYYSIAKRLARLNAFDPSEIMYLTETPFKLHNVDDLFLEAYNNGIKLKTTNLGTDVKNFVKRCGSFTHERRNVPIISKKESRRYGLGLALSMNDKRDLYSEAENHPKSNGLFVSLINGNPSVKKIERKKILVIEDDSNLLDVVKRLLSTNYDVDAISISTHGISRLQDPDYRTDLVLTDIMMPVVNGFEIAAAAKERGFPVVLMSAHGKEEVYRKALGVGVKGFIDKPFERDKLFEEISKAVPEDSKVILI